MNPKILELRKQANDLLTKAKALEGPEMSGEDLTKANGYLDDAQNLLDQAKGLEEYAAKRDAATKSLERRLELADRNGIRGQAAEDAVEAEFKAVAEFLKAGGDRGRMSEESRKALSESSGPNGGFWVGKETSNEVITAIREDLAVLRIARVYQTSSPEFEIPAAAITMTNNWVADNESSTDTDPTGVAGMVSIKPKTLISSLPMPRSLMQDALPQIIAWLKEEIPYQMKLEWEKRFIYGNGVGKPLGILNGGLTGVDIGTATSTVIVPADIRGLPHQLPMQYQAGCSWFMPRATFAKIDLLRTNDGGSDTGRFMWEPDLTLPSGKRLCGFPVDATEQWPAIENAGGGADGDALLLFGNFRRGYSVVIRDDVSLDIITGDWILRKKNQDGLICISRVDGGVTDAASILRLNRT